MVTVTAEAKDLLQELLRQAEQQGAPVDENTSIRLAQTAPVEGQEGQVGLSLVLDEPHEGDQVVEHEGKKILLVDPATSDLLQGVTLDAVDTPDGRRLTFHQ
ncbi:MAG: HesB/IscA family protein [Sphingomonadaceae bacterium]